MGEVGFRLPADSVEVPFGHRWGESRAFCDRVGLVLHVWWGALLCTDAVCLERLLSLGCSDSHFWLEATSSLSPSFFSLHCSTCHPLWELRLFPLQWFDPWLRCQGVCVKGLLRIMSQRRKMPVRAEDVERLLTLSPLLLKWQSWCWTGHFPLTVPFIYFHQVLRCHKSQVYLYSLVKAALLWERCTAGNGISLCRRGQIPVSSNLPNWGFSIWLRLSR